MPLSDNEQHLLEQMEKALLAEDPKFASTMRGSARRSASMTRVVIGFVAVVAGLLTLVAGVANAQLVVGVLGFVLMLGGTVFALSARRRGGGPSGVVASDGTVRRATVKPTAKRTDGFMQRMERRWDRRRDER